MRGLTVIVAGPDPRRFHAALSMAAASAAAGAATRVYLHGDAVLLLVPPLRSPDDDRHRMSGLPTLAQMLDEALILGVRLICCQSGLAMDGIAAESLDSRIEVGGLVGLLSTLGDDRLVTVQPMPELPEVETTICGLRPVLAGQRLASVEPRRADLRRAIPPDLRQRLTGATVTNLGRRAKYGLIDTDRGDTLIFHLGMQGRWRIDPATISPHDHLLIETDGGCHLALHDPRRFGSLDLIRTESLANFPPFLALGPEPLGNDFNGAHLAKVLAGRVAPIKALLLDQRVVAGLGNIYVCEALNLARIAPGRPAGGISRARLDLLATAIRSVLEAAIEAGGSSLRDYARPDGELGYFSKQWRVYGSEGEDCPCGTGVAQRRVDNGRSTFFCAKCQR